MTSSARSRRTHISVRCRGCGQEHIVIPYEWSGFCADCQRDLDRSGYTHGEARTLTWREHCTRIFLGGEIRQA